MRLAPLLLALAPGQEPADIGAACDALLRRHMLAGWSGAALVARGGKPLLARGYGRADRQREEPNRETTLFEIASVSKPFTAAAILKLEQQGRLSTADSIEDHLPGVPAHSRKITILQLLSHTSGIPRTNDAGSGEDLEPAVVAYLGAGPTSAPGAHFEYWNGGYALLAGIVERASGRRFTRYCEEELFAPAGMLDTGFTGDSDLDPARAATGWSTQGEPRSALAHPYGSFGYEYRGMGGVVTTTLDLLKWDRALAGTAVLGEKARRKLFTPIQEGYACGWRVGKSKSGKLRQWHEGVVRGFAADLRRFPEEDVCIAVLSNTDGVKAGEIAENLECVVFGRPLEHPPPAAALLAEDDLARFTGSYATKGGRLHVRAVEGGLELAIEGQALLDDLAPVEHGERREKLERWNDKAVEFIEALARGDVSFLRQSVTDEDRDGWPKILVQYTWPRQTAQKGALKSVRALGATSQRDSVKVLVALEHERGPARAELTFTGKGLVRLEWEGPEFLATLKLSPRGGSAFEVSTGEPPRRFEFTRKGERITGLTTDGWKLSRME
ncbi:MAG TPA: serine hydrolase domain-containing protein [Planctomycetota bacterium]